MVSLRQDGSYKFLSSNSVLHNLYVLKSLINPQQQRAIDEFEELINSNDASENEFQEFFKSFPNFIINDSYRTAHSQIVLQDSQPRKLIPDFVLEPYNANSLCDILELKRPNTKLFVDKRNRPRFSAAVFEAVAQLREYHEYFEQEINRNKIEKQYGLKLFRPRLILIIGRRGRLSPIQFKKAQSDFPTVTVETYDDLLDRIKERYGRNSP